ncbi:MarR family winged helix-turn-helix transcriptional regulator [Streptomyces sp. NPDC058662]|uniref:MarR family winged helix-turn-helix transcriptional regulator n=1 Tax=Streptomyces sp. NPDC058662 TaxID=3346583 RepID=UPI00364D1488
MPAPAPGPRGIDNDAARSVNDIVELLDVVWENARQSAAVGAASPAQLRLMYLVDRQPGLRMRALAHLLGAAAPSVTRLCDRLEAIGFLTRHSCAHSGREVTLRLTPAGETHLAQIRENRARALAHAFEAMTSDGRRALATGLAALSVGLTAGGADSPGQEEPAA